MGLGTPRDQVWENLNSPRGGLERELKEEGGNSSLLPGRWPRELAGKVRWLVMFVHCRGDDIRRENIKKNNQK